MHGWGLVTTCNVLWMVAYQTDWRGNKNVLNSGYFIPSIDALELWKILILV